MGFWRALYQKEYDIRSTLCSVFIYLCVWFFIFEEHWGTKCFFFGLWVFALYRMSFLESSSNTTKNTSSKDQSFTSERDTSTTLAPSKNKWTVDLRRKGAAATPSSKAKTNLSQNTTNDNTNNRSSCTFSNDVFYSGKDELETIKDDAKPILKLWASRSKQNLANRNSGTFKSTENITANGKTTSFEKETTKDSTPAPRHVKARYLSTSKLELNENELNEQRQNKENEEVGVINTSHRNGNNKETTYTNGNRKDVAGRLSSQKSDIPIKRVTTKSKHIGTNVVTGGVQVEKTTTDKTESKTNTENTSSRRKLKSPEFVSEDKDKNISNKEAENAELVRGKGINKRKKNKGILEYTHLNFLKSKKSEKSDTQIPIKRSTDTFSIVDRYTTDNCDKEKEVNIDKDNKYVPDLNCKNNTYRNSENNVTKTNGVNAISNGKTLETNGLDNKSNGHVHESNGIHDKGKVNGLSKFDSNKFNISANNSLRKDNRKDSGQRPAISRNQKFFVKSCDISLDSENEEPENSEILQTTTRTILNNLDWDPSELTNKQIDNSPRYSELHSEIPVKTIAPKSKQNGENKSAHVSEEITATFDKLLNEEFNEPLNEDLIDKQNTKTKMSNRTSYISRSINSTSQLDDKSDTHRRLIRTSSSQIEKPTIHSRRLSNIEGSNSIDNYIKRKVSTDLDRVNRNRFNTCDNGKDITTTKRTFTRSQTIDVESRRYSFEKGISDNDRSGDEFQPKSNFLRQKLKEIDNKQAQLQSKEPRKFSLGQQNTFDENNSNKVDSFVRSYNRGRWSSDSSNVSINGISENLKNGSEVNGERVSSALSELRKNDLRRSSSSSSTSSLRSNGLSAITTNGIGKVENSQSDDLDKEMNFEFRRNFSLPKDRTTQNGKIPISKQTSDNSSISRFSFSSRSNSNRSSGRSNKSISPSSSTQSLDSNNSDVSGLKSSSLSIPAFGSITKVQPSKLSDAKALQSTFSFRRKEKRKQLNSPDLGSPLNDYAHYSISPKQDSGDECVPLETPASQDETTSLFSNDNTEDPIEIIDSQPSSELIEDKNELETKSPDMERRASGPKSPTSGSFSLFKGRSNSTDKSPHSTSKSISSYFNFNKKDKVKKDGESVSSPPLSPVCGDSEGSTSVDYGKENNDITNEPPLSPPAEGRTERRGSTLKRLFQKKSSDIVSPRQSFDADSEKKARTLSENGSSEVTNEPTKIKTKAKYIDSDFKAVDPLKEEDEQSKMNIMTSTPTKEPVKNEKKTTSRVLSISTRSIKKESSIDKVTETPIEKTVEPLLEEKSSVEVVDEKPIIAKTIQKQSSTEIDINKLISELDEPDQVSMPDNKSTANELDVVPAVTKVERRNRRRDRRHQALNTNDIDTALIDQPKEEAPSKTELDEAVPMETNEAESLEKNNISLVAKSNSLNESDLKNISVCSSIADDSVFLSPNRDDCGSSESLYASDASTKGFSSNKERIKNRKAARLEAAERRRQLNLDNIGEISMTIPSKTDSMEIDVSNGKLSSDDSPKDVSGTDKPSPPEVKPKKRKKHKAQRSNTEFISLPRTESEEVQSPVKASQDDGIVMRRNNKRGNQRRDRPRTLTAGIDADMISSARQMAADDSAAASGVVNENMSFAEIKKKLLEGTQKEEKIEKPEKSSSKKREKIKRTKSTKRYKTITEGIAPRDLALAAQQAKEASQQSGNTIDKATLEQITASLSLASDKRKSFRVESRPGSRHQSTEDLRMSDGDVEMSPEPEKPTLQRTKSMTTLHLNIDLSKEKDSDDDEPEIKPLSELKNRFLQAMEESNAKHKEKKIVVDIAEIKRKNQRGDRANRPYTICGLDDLSMDKWMGDIGQIPDSDLQKENKENLIRSRNESFSSNKIINGSQNHISDEKSKSNGLAQDIINHLEDLDVSESELDDLLNDKNDKKDEETKVIEEKKPDVDLSQLDDLDFVSHQSSQLSSKHISDKRNIRPQRRQRASAANNPIKSLQQRDDLLNDADLQAKDANKSNQKSAHPVVDAYRGLSQTSKQNPADRLLNRRDLADEAVNALRATVDFSKTKLKKVVVAPQAVGVIEESFKPTEITNVLLQIKGRRKVQTSIVKFSVDSLNSNDCFIVLTPKDLLCWYGAQSNVIEKSKAAEVASRLFQKKEMGCKAFDVLYVEQSGQVENKIIRLLGGEAGDKIDTSKSAVNDEEFEKALSSAYMTYIVCERNDPPELIPLDSQCHRMPSKEILQTDSAFVFDFLDEVYVWLGRKTNSAQRQVIQKLAAEKFDEGYHKLDLHESHHNLGKTRAINTLTNESGPHLSRRASGAARRGSAKSRRAPEQKVQKEKEPRPPHAILCQLFEGSEWVVFKEKFCDWPDESRIIRMKGGPESVGEITKEVSTEIVINPVDADEMIKPFLPPKMVLDMVDVGRGRGIPKGMDGYHVITIDVKTWHVCENKSILLPDESFGQFHSGEGYVVRWQYKIVKVRNLRNCPDISKAGGMEKCCYFFWLGNDCSVNEEGATAVMTIELDQEKGPQIRVVLGKEPPALLNIFDGSMVIHAGKRPVPGIRENFTDNSVIRLYCIRNEIASEACLLQVPPYCESLRSRSSFVLLLCQQGEVLLWHGCRSNEGTRASAEHAAKQLMANHPDEASIADMTELGFTIIEEGEEPEEFWILLGGKEDYGSMIDDPVDTTELSPRLFKLESATGSFIPTEIVSPSKTDLHNCPFPILQDDLYNVDQPAIFLLDAKTHIYLWFGWWPEDLDAEAHNSRRRRWNEERKKAMESAQSYANALERPLSNMYAIYAGLEPESFIELFPYWVVQDDITDLQIDEGIEEGKLYKITEELAAFSKEFYTIEELRASSTPQGVDPTKLEKYLSDEDFLALFGFTKESFYTLPGWQQVNWKKKLGLY